MTLTDLILFPLPLLGALLSTLLLVPLMKRVAPLLGLVDQPSERRIHKQPIPRCGGLAVFLGFHSGLAVLYLLPGMDFSMRLDGVWWWHLFLTSGLIVAVGLVDDMIEIKPLVKLAGQFAAASLAYWFGMRVTNLLGFRLPFLLDYGITVFWFLGAMNAFNLIDGMDGVAGGLGGIAALAIAGQLLLQQYPGDVLVALCLAAACLAFLRYNFNPASVFMGDAGSMFIGFMVAGLSLSTGAKGTTVASLSVPLVAVGVPAFDTFLAIWRRSVRRWLRRQHTSGGDKSGEVFSADLDHLHHRLLRFGLSHRQVALMLYGLAGSLALVALLGLLLRSHTMAIYLLAFLVGVYVVVRHLAYVELWDSTTALVNGIRRPPRAAVAVVLYPAFDAVVLSVGLALSLWLLMPQASLGGIRSAWLLHAPWWIAFPFLGLVATRTYQRVWSRTRISEFAFTALGLLVGCVVGLATMEIFTSAGRAHLLALFFMYSGLVLMGVLALRVLPRLIQDVAIHVRNAHSHRQRQGTVRTLVYGAGYSCTLYLRARSFEPFDPESRYHVVVGLMDDDSNLHGRYVHGCPVLGGGGKLVEVLRERAIDELVVTVFMDEPAYQAMLDACAAAGVKVVRWRTNLQHHDLSDLHYTFDKLLATHAPRLLNLPMAQIGDEVDRLLEQASALAVAQGCFLARLPMVAEGGMISIRGWFPPDLGPAHCRAAVELLLADTVIAERLRAGETVALKTMREILNGAGVNRLNWQALDVESMIAVPVRFENRLIGILALEAVSSGLLWKDESLRMLSVLGNILGIGLLREGLSNVGGNLPDECRGNRVRSAGGWLVAGAS